MKAALSIVLAGFFFACFVGPQPLAGQACQGVAVPTGSPSVWLRPRTERTSSGSGAGTRESDSMVWRLSGGLAPTVSLFDPSIQTLLKASRRC
jgi:hypothetical protein